MNEPEKTPPVEQLGGTGSPLLFSHANGFPPGAYRALLEPFFPQHRVLASLHRPLWLPAQDPESIDSWLPFANDVLAVASSQSEPVISVGHSMGASAAVLAAARRPESFRALVLMEPVLVPRAFPLLLRLFRHAGADRVPLVRRTLQRTDRWDSTEQAFAHFRNKAIFRRIEDSVLRDYIDHGTVAEGGAVRLRYSKQWEARCYKLVHDLWSAVNRLQVPVLALRGAESDTLSKSSWRRWQRMSPKASFIEVDGTGHLLPLEEPDLIAAAIQQWLDEQPGGTPSS